MLINQSNISLLNKGFKKHFQNGFDGAKELVQWERIATRVPSTTGTEEYGWLGAYPRLREWIGERHINKLAAHGYSVKNKDFEATIEVDVNSVKDDTYGTYNLPFQGLGESAAVHPDELVFGLLANGHQELCYDRQYFFDPDHPVGDGVVSNIQAGGGSPWYLLDTRRVLKPLIYQVREDYQFSGIDTSNSDIVFKSKKYLYGVDGRSNVGFGFWQMAYMSQAALDAVNYEAAKKNMSLIKDDAGKFLNIRPNLLVTGPTNESAAKALFLTEQLAGGGTNVNFNDVEVLIVPELG